MIRQCGQEAIRAGVKAYVRVTHPFYKLPLVDGHASEQEDVTPDGTRGYWWHESLRALAAMPE